MSERDYYIILGVSRSESPDRIHDAFRKLAKQYHPDRGGPEATETFQEIAQAYEILSDPTRRRQYDESLRSRERIPISRSPGRRHGSYRAEPLVPEPMSVLHGFQTLRPSFDALFEEMLRNFDGVGVSKAEVIQDLNMEVILTPAEAARGVVAPIALPIFRPCSACDGGGRDWLFPCMTCGGEGMFEGYESVSVEIPPLVPDRSVIEVPIHGLGIHNFYLRLHIRISE